MSFQFATIASGSSGNCLYTGSEHTKILIDAGISGKKVTDSLNQIGVTGFDIDGIFVTHEHSDHIQGVGILSRKYNIPIYATKGTWEGMESSIGNIKPHNIKYVYNDEEIVLNDLVIKPFKIPHDANEPMAYSIYTDKHKLTLATDMGHITKGILDNLKDSDALILESNHDIKMLQEGDYPYHLKQRILGKNGHLSNELAGKVLACVMSGKLKNVFLAHLSRDNNTPNKAFTTVSDILKEYDIEIGTYLNVEIAPREGLKNLVELD